MVNGQQWSMVNGQWSMVNGECQPIHDSLLTIDYSLFDYHDSPFTIKRGDGKNRLHNNTTYIPSLLM
jgi:hypothetical protein